MFERVILLTGMPRSGTSWVSQIFDSSPQVRFRLSPLFSYEFKNKLNEDSTEDDWRALLYAAYHSESEFMSQARRRTVGEYPVFVEKDHAPPILVIKDTRFHNLTEPMLRHIDNVKVVAIVRNPCGAIHSWLTAPREFPYHANPLEEWRYGECRKTGYGEYWGFEDWKAVTRHHIALAEQTPARVIIQRYEDMAHNAFGETRKLFDFCGMSFSRQTEEFLHRSQSAHVENEYAVFKNPDTAERWRRELQPEIRDAILAEIKGTPLERFV